MKDSKVATFRFRKPVPEQDPHWSELDHKPRYTDVVFALLSGGPMALARMRPRPSTGVLRRAGEELLERGHVDLAKHVWAALPIRGRRAFPGKPRPGRKKPKPGDTRKYTQRDKRGSFSVLIPIDTLQLTDDQKVVAEFGRDQIILRRDDG